MGLAAYPNIFRRLAARVRLGRDSLDSRFRGNDGGRKRGNDGRERKTINMINSTHLERAIAEGLAEIVGDGRGARIRYVDADRSERWTDPEEKFRAELWAELVYKYGYPARRVRRWHEGEPCSAHGRAHL